MKLTPAKCPSCGANLEVNEKLEKTICQYCGTTVLIEEAIEKYKIELSGKVEVEGIKSDAQKIENAKKHMKIGEYMKAQSLLNQVNNEDSFNIEAQCMWIKNAILMNQLTVGFFGDNYAREDFYTVFKAVDLILESFERLKKIDEKEEYKEFLKDELDTIEYIAEEERKLNEDDEEVSKYTRQILDKTNFNTLMLLLYNELHWNKSEVQWLKMTVDIKPKGWSSTIPYQLKTFKISRTGGVYLYYASKEYNYNAEYYYNSTEGPYTKEQTIEKLNTVIGFLNDPKYMKKLNKLIDGYHWSRVDYSKMNKKGLFGIF